MNKSIATGAALNAHTWADFVERLRHDCEGEGVNDHHTADAIFNVEVKRLTYGINEDYTDNRVVYCDDSKWFSPIEYWNESNEDDKANLNKLTQKRSELDFLESSEDDQWDILSDLDNHTVTGWIANWVTINSHFTKDAAEAFVKRKKHDYPDGIRTYVDAQSYCWEFNTIKEAILHGHLVFKEFP